MRSNISGLLSSVVFAVAVLNLCGPGHGDDATAPPRSGPEIGSEIASFYIRAVTGPHAGKTTCYVCRNGDRPVVMVFLRELGPDSARLLRQLNAAVDAHRADSLRCFVVLLSDSTIKDSARLQTLSFDEKLDIPLTIASDAAIGPIARTMAPQAAITVVLYNDLKVLSCHAYRSGKCDDVACRAIAAAAIKMATESAKK